MLVHTVFRACRMAEKFIVLMVVIFLRLSEPITNHPNFVVFPRVQMAILDASRVLHAGDCTEWPI